MHPGLVVGALAAYVPQSSAGLVMEDDGIDADLERIRAEAPPGRLTGRTVKRMPGTDADHTSGDEADPAAVEDETIPVELGGVTTLISRSDIEYARAQGDYARLHTASGSHLVRIPLNTLEERWESAGFVRIHRSTLVSTSHIKQVRRERGRFVVVVEGAELQVSRRHTRDVRERLLKPRTAER